MNFVRKLCAENGSIFSFRGCAPEPRPIYHLLKAQWTKQVRGGEVEETFEKLQSTPLTLATHVGGRISHLNIEMFQGMASRNDASGTAGVMGRGIEGCIRYGDEMYYESGKMVHNRYVYDMQHITKQVVTTRKNEDAGSAKFQNIKVDATCYRFACDFCV